MKKDIRARVLQGEIVDTRKYRYVLKECYDNEKQWHIIQRLPIEDLGTTAALGGWETVEVIL